MIRLIKSLVGILIVAGIFTAIDVNNTVTDEVKGKYGYVTVQEQTTEAETEKNDLQEKATSVTMESEPVAKPEPETAESSSESFEFGQTKNSEYQETKEDEGVKEAKAPAFEVKAAETTGKSSIPVTRKTECETVFTFFQNEKEPVKDTAWNAEPETTAHVHTWEPLTECIFHDQETGDVWVVDKAALDETVTYDEPVYDEHLVIIATCRGCKAQFTGSELDDVLIRCGNHIVDVHNNACGYGLEDSYWEQTQTGTAKRTETVHHDEEGHWETVVTKDAYNEVKVTGCLCTGCGAEK